MKEINIPHISKAVWHHISARCPKAPSSCSFIYSIHPILTIFVRDKLTQKIHTFTDYNFESIDDLIKPSKIRFLINNHMLTAS